MGIYVMVFLLFITGHVCAGEVENNFFNRIERYRKTYFDNDSTGRGGTLKKLYATLFDQKKSMIDMSLDEHGHDNRMVVMHSLILDLLHKDKFLTMFDNEQQTPWFLRTYTMLNRFFYTQSIKSFTDFQRQNIDELVSLYEHDDIAEYLKLFLKDYENGNELLDFFSHEAFNKKSKQVKNMIYIFRYYLLLEKIVLKSS